MASQIAENKLKLNHNAVSGTRMESSEVENEIGIEIQTKFTTTEHTYMNQRSVQMFDKIPRVDIVFITVTFPLNYCYS